MSLRQLIIKTFPNSSIPKDIHELKMGDIEEWDSMGNFNLILAVEQHYGVQFNLDDMEKIKIVEATTQAGFKRNSFIYDFMSSMRQKINDPLGQRAKKRKEISQR